MHVYAFFMRCTLLGTGTSHGIPVIGCSCGTCTSCDPKDKRTRTSALFECCSAQGNAAFVIDTGPEFRIQALTYGITRLDAVFITHDHADHLHGIDDLRVFSCCKPGTAQPHTGLPLYSNAQVLKSIRTRFPYIFKDIKTGGGRPQLQLCSIEGKTAAVGPMTVRAVPLVHGNARTTGCLVSHTAPDGSLHSIAYLTDCKTIPESSYELLARYGGSIDHLVIDALRVRPHGTHLSFEEALLCAARIGAVHTWLFHICHDMRHAQIMQYVSDICQKKPELRALTENGRTAAPAYDGLQLETC